MINEGRKRQAKDYPILDLAERLGIEIKNRMCRCINPYHDDKNPSMSFDPKTNLYKCFSCGFKGDTIELVKECKNIGFTEAIDFILGFEHSNTIAYTRNAVKTQAKGDFKDSRKDGANYADIYGYFIDLLAFPDETHYLVTDRKISLQILIQNNIKALRDKQQFWNIYNKLKDYYGEDRIKNSGIISLCECTAIIPFYENDKTVYMQGLNSTSKRLLKGLQTNEIYTPKFINNTPIHLCEGLVTALYMTTYGYNSIAIVSANVCPDKTIQKLEYYKDNYFVLCPDIDITGKEIMDKIKLKMFKKGFKYHSEYFNPLDIGRKLKLTTEELYKIDDFNDLRTYFKKNKIGE